LPIDINIRLLVVKVYCTICCKEKRKDAQPLKARERYMAIRIEDTYEKAQAEELPFFILSGKIGLIRDDAKIPFYDVILEEEGVEDLLKKVKIQLAHYKITDLKMFGFLVEKNPTWKPYYDVIERACKELDVKYEFEKLRR
jgi:hypothetical protein